jgi:hypothetical protein
METLLNSKVGFAIVAANSMKALNVANAGKLSKPHNLPTLDLQKGTVSPFANMVSNRNYYFKNGNS